MAWRATTSGAFIVGLVLLVLSCVEILSKIPISAISPLLVHANLFGTRIMS